jgi:hypothetical protein
LPQKELDPNFVFTNRMTGWKTVTERIIENGRKFSDLHRFHTIYLWNILKMSHVKGAKILTVLLTWVRDI